jgi:hypothetical protein
VTLSLGSKIALLIAIVLVIAAAYMYWVPLTVPNSTGAPFGCQTAANPPTDAFPKNYCGSINTTYRYRALALMACAVVIAAGGFFMLGEPRVETRDARRPDPDRPGAGLPGPGLPGPGLPGPGRPDLGRPDPGRLDPGLPGPGRPDQGNHWQ